MDGYVRQIRDAIARAGIADRTYLLIVSDHGFAPTERQLQPNALFKKEGLLLSMPPARLPAGRFITMLKEAPGRHRQNPDDQALVSGVARCSTV